MQQIFEELLCRCPIVDKTMIFLLKSAIDRRSERGGGQNKAGWVDMY